MTSAAGRRTGKKGALTAARGTISRRKASGTGAEASPHKGSSGERPSTASLCGVCLKPLPPGAGAKFCSSRHRLMAWWLRELVKALHDGTAEGLRDEVRKIGEMLAQTERAKGAPGPGRGKPGAQAGPAFNDAPTLSDLGLSKKESSRAQMLAALDSESSGHPEAGAGRGGKRGGEGAT